MASQSQTLVLRQAQQLVLTPQMQQSLKILQLSSLDLEEYLETEIEKNPLIEKESDETQENENVENTSNENSETKEFEAPDISEKDSFENLNSEKFKEDSGLDSEDTNWNSDDYSKENYGEYENYTEKTYNAEDSDAGSIIEKNFSEQITLKDHLLDQINVDIEDSAKKIIATHLIEMLDSKGYLSHENLDEELGIIANRLACPRNEIDNLIIELQKLDPIGVFARNLEECLKIQLIEKDRFDPAMKLLLENLPLLAKGELQKLKKICNVDDEDLTLMIAEIKSLNPRPASNFSESEPSTKIPDMYLVKKNGKWEIELNHEIMPKLRVKKDYYKKVKSGKIKEEHKEYLNHNLNTANFLIRAISQRYDSILKVSGEIVSYQKDFFDKGINFLKPLTMRQIAETVELHESTIGRVVANKYIATPRGVFELKYFFTNSLQSNYSDNDVSTETVRSQIRILIEQETKVLSDDDIAEKLNEKGINIARRTVAKYREALHIPTSAERKRTKRVTDFR